VTLVQLRRRIIARPGRLADLYSTPVLGLVEAREARMMSTRCARGLAGALICGLVAVGRAQVPPGVGLQVPPLAAGPWEFDTAEQQRIRVSVVARGLSHPWSLAFLPDGGLLVTERPGRLRVVRDGRLDPTPVAGLPRVRTDGNGGLMDIALHPRFADTRLVYFTYTKPVENGRGTPVLARGRLEGGALTDVRDLIVPDAYDGNSGLGARVVFGRDGMVYVATGGNIAKVAQDPASLRGKILRLRDDGSVPDDNPFVGRPGYRPEVFTLGHRNTLALIVHPETGAVWNSENGPNGGDEINVIERGRNYGWPIVSFGREYPGPRVSEHPTREGMESPLVAWIPSIAASGMAVYTGDRFPKWKGNVFVGAMRVGEIPGTGHLQRIAFNAKMEEIRRESLLTEFRLRIREVRQGPDGLLYLLTDEDDGALLRIEPM
jgi:aldose sugar dehydrogenase